MSVMKPLTLAAMIAPLVLGTAMSRSAFADPAATPTKPAATDAADTKTDGKTEKKFTKAQLEAFLSKCSEEADAKGLDIKKGKGAARKEFRRECMHKFGVDPK